VLKLFLSFLFSFAYMMILMPFTGFPEISLNRSLLASVYTGFFETGITFLFWLKALRLSGSVARISNLVYLTPFLSLICIHFVLQEQLHLTTVTGLVLVVFGLVLQQAKKTGS
jgi:drug/metabolite transporter (DMT)-like permease